MNEEKREREEELAAVQPSRARRRVASRRETDGRTDGRPGRAEEKKSHGLPRPQESHFTSAFPLSTSP